jgi:hypothetical protein
VPGFQLKRRAPRTESALPREAGQPAPYGRPQDNARSFNYIPPRATAMGETCAQGVRISP